MNVRVTLLRHEGTPIPQKQQKAVDGILRYEERGALGYVAAVTDPNGKTYENVVTPIIRVFLAHVQPAGFTLSGLEAEEDSAMTMGPLFMQQWFIEPLPVTTKGKKFEVPPEDLGKEE